MPVFSKSGAPSCGERKSVPPERAPPSGHCRLLAFAGPATRGTLSAGKRIRISRAATVMVGAWVHVFMKAFHAVEPLFPGRALVVGEHPAPW
jgi:hypothetical protein